MTNGRWFGLCLVAVAGAALAGPVEQDTAAAIARARAVDGRLHSIIALDPTAIAQARQRDSMRFITAPGPMFGKPVLIKDNIETAGPLATTAGSLVLKDNVTGRDAPLVARLRGAGAVILGKSNLSEWANIRSTASISGWSAIGGQTRNPYALDRNTCGSSSGSGAAVAAGIVDYAIGTETDGSITCPASLNGIVGMKPTVGLVSRTHIIPISISQDTAGPMTRTVRQGAELLSVIAGSDPRDKATREADRRRVNFAAGLSRDALRGTRLGVMRFASGFGTDPAFDTALALLKAQGATLVEIKAFDDKPIGANELTVLLSELKTGMNAYLATTPRSVTSRTLADVIAFNRANAPREMALFGQELFERAQKTKGLKDPAYLKARRLSFAAAGPNGIDRLIKIHRLDALIGPTMPAAWKIDAVHGDQISGGGAGSLAAVAGYPHLTVPMGLVKGLPVGLSFLGPKWSDGRLLRFGFAYEAARGGFPNPRLLESIEASPEIAPLLEPASR
jgi:amidase